MQVYVYWQYPNLFVSQNKSVQMANPHPVQCLELTTSERTTSERTTSERPAPTRSTSVDHVDKAVNTISSALEELPEKQQSQLYHILSWSIINGLNISPDVPLRKQATKPVLALLNVLGATGDDELSPVNIVRKTHRVLASHEDVINENPEMQELMTTISLFALKNSATR